MAENKNNQSEAQLGYMRLERLSKSLTLNEQAQSTLD